MLWIRIRIHFGRLDPDPDPGGHKLHTKVKKCQVFEVLDVLFWGMKTSPVAWTFFLEAMG
jgi:hypothetical protein